MTLVAVAVVRNAAKERGSEEPETGGNVHLRQSSASKRSREMQQWLERMRWRGNLRRFFPLQEGRGNSRFLCEWVGSSGQEKIDDEMNPGNNAPE